MSIKLLIQGSLLVTSMACYGQTSQPIINDASLQFLSSQICDCLSRKQLEKQAAAEALRTCFEDEFVENGPKILADNNLEASQEIGQKIGVLLARQLSKDCAVYTAFRVATPEQKVVNDAEALQKAGKHQEALGLYNKLIGSKLISLDWTIYNQRGLSKVEIGDFYGALADFEFAIQRDSTGIVAYNNRGLAKYRLGDKQGAFNDYTHAIELDSTLALAYENRGVVLYDDDQYDLAKIDLLKAVALNPASVVGYYYLGLCGKASENYSDTTAGYFTKALTLDPTNYQYQNARGLFYDDKKDYKKARADYVAAISLQTDYNPAYYNLAQLDIAENKPADALRNLNTAIRLDSTYAIYFNKKAQVLLQLKRYKEALAACDQAIATNEQGASAYDTRGSVCDATGNAKGAVEAYTKSIALADRDGLIYYRRGLARLKLNDTSGACEDFQMGKLFRNDEAAKAVQQHCIR